MVNVKNQHVVPRDDIWTVKSAEGEKASRLFDNQKDAIEYAKVIAKRNNICMVVHDESGKFKDFKCGNEIKLSEHKKSGVIEPLMDHGCESDSEYIDKNMVSENNLSKELSENLCV